MPGRHHARDAYGCEQRLDEHRRRHPKDFPQPEALPTPRRGEIRLAAEVAIIALQGILIPRDQVKAFTIARSMTLNILGIVAKN